MKIIGPFTQLIGLEGLPFKGALSDEKLTVKRGGAVVVEGGEIIEVGKFKELRRDLPNVKVEKIEKPMVLVPGFIDCHTHICFSGDRSQDFGMRLNGKTYLEIAESGGGIWRTVQATRKASVEELVKGILSRTPRMLKNGITTAEIKSGYGLSVSSELRMLEAIKVANANSSVDMVSTFLGAHMRPQDFNGDNSEYLEYLIKEIIPQIIQNKYTTRVDIFVEQSAFDVNESRMYLRGLQQLGFNVCVHADQFSKGGSRLAVEVGALSADHLEASGEEEIKYLANSNTIGVALPGASLGLGEPFTPARKLLDFGGCLAIASDWNPGSAPMGDLLTQASILATYENLSAAEVFAALTFRAAAALKLNNVGRIAKGFKANLVAFPTKNYENILYNQGQMKPAMVWKEGEVLDFS